MGVVDIFARFVASLGTAAPRVKNETEGIFSVSYTILSHLLTILSLKC